MIDELCIGRRYRFTLRDPALPGYLEGELRSTSLPRGTLGNNDGEHRVWVSGELFEWFLRIEDIGSIQELVDEPPEPSSPEVPRELCSYTTSWLRRRYERRPERVESPSEYAFACNRRPGA